jgi:hypothetical protein
MPKQHDPASYWLAYHREHPALHDETPVGLPPPHPHYSGPVGRLDEENSPHPAVGEIEGRPYDRAA